MTIWQRGVNTLRDLKHLIRFEELLRAANNELVKQACAEGKLALGYNCSYIPEVLLDVEGCCGLRLRAPGCTSPDMATYYMTNRSCPYSKSILERAFEGGYNFLDALIGQECCCTMNRMEQYFDYCGLIPKEKFFVACIDMPINRSDWHVGYYRRQMEKKILAPLEETYGVDFSEEKLRAAIAEHNELCRIIGEMGDMRKAENPVITGYEFHVMQLVSLTCPRDAGGAKGSGARTEALVPRPCHGHRRGDRRPGVHKDAGDVRGHGRCGPLLLRLHAGQGRDRDKGRRVRARRYRQALPL